jgi:hypothetical protein
MPRVERQEAAHFETAELAEGNGPTAVVPAAP